MNPLKRAAQALAGVCRDLPLRAVALGVAVAASCTVVPSSHALMSRTGRPHVRAAAQDQEPSPTHSRASRRKAAKPAAPAARRSTHTSAPAQEKSHATARTRGKGHHAHPVPAADDDPVTMRRAKGKTHASPAPAARRLAAAKAAPAAKTAAPVHVAAAHPRSTIRQKPPVETADGASATSDDFVRAAGGVQAANDQAASDSPAEGTSHPDEAVLDRPATATRVDHVAAAPAETPVPATTRIDGFGAEGVPAPAGRRTLAKTMAAHRTHVSAAVNVPAPPSAAEQQEITEEAVRPVVVPALYTRGGRVIMPAPLKGSHDVLVHQNLMADNEGLERIHDEEQLDRMVAEHQLARLPENGSLHLNPELPENRRYARPWTAKFAADTAHAFAARFGVPLQVNSAVRTVSYQLRLMRVNGNAAAIDGDTASPHLTGQAIDIGKRSMSKAQLAWMRAYLLPFMQAGKIDVEEEFHQACFHVSVYRSYQPAADRRLRAEVESAHPDAAAARTPGTVHTIEAVQ